LRPEEELARYAEDGILSDQLVADPGDQALYRQRREAVRHAGPRVRPPVEHSIVRWRHGCYADAELDAFFAEVARELGIEVPGPE
jgi:hypothetical protein